MAQTSHEQVWLVNNEAILKQKGRINLSKQHFVRWWLRHQALLVFPLFTGMHNFLAQSVSLFLLCAHRRTKYDELAWVLLHHGYLRERTYAPFIAV